MENEREQATFGPIDDVLEALASVPGVDDNKDERLAAREQMERDFQEGRR